MTAWKTMPTQERARRCRELIAKGHRPRDIADELGATRNAVIGFCNRQGIALYAEAPTAPKHDMRKVVLELMPLIDKHARFLARGFSDDVVQEACKSILCARSYDPSRNASGWVRQHVMSARNKLLRQRYEYDTVGEDMSRLEGEPEAASQEASAEVAMLLRRAEALPDRQRTILRLVVDGNNPAEAAKLMGIRKQAGHQALDRARKSLGLAA